MAVSDGSPPLNGGEGGTYFSGPLQLVRIDDDGQLHAQERAVSILRQIQGRLAVVSIAGLYRTGKSFLLNRVLGLQDGFEVGPSVNPCTKGLWIWGQPVRLAPDYHLVIIDAEGLGSAQRTATCDMQIFSLCVLLSSSFIYNSIGAIDEQAIDDLHLVLQMAKRIHVKSGSAGETETASELAQHFPRFHWVLRDFHLKLVNKQGERITERDYLEDALKPTPGSDGKNEVRNMIRDLFRERDCSTMVRPVANEADLRRVQQLPYESLRPEFRLQVEAFVKKVYSSLHSKRINGTHVSGALLALLTAEYCQAINNGAVPTIRSSWASAVQHQLRLSLRDAVQLYREEMNEKVMKHLPMGEDELRCIHKAAKAEAVRVLKAAGLTSEPVCRSYQAELVGCVKQLRDHAVTANAGASQRQCEQVAEELWNAHIGSKLGRQGSYQSYRRLMQDWEEVRQAYAQQAKGPAKPEVLANLLLRRLTDGVGRAWDSCRSHAEEKHTALQQRLIDAEVIRNIQDNEGLKESDALELGRRRWITDKIKLEVRLQDMRRDMEEAARHASLEKAQLADSERTCREQMKIWQEKVRVLEAKSSSDKAGVSSLAAAELQSLKDAIASTMSEVKNVDMERKELELKAQHERQLLGLEREFRRKLAAARSGSDVLLEDLRKSYDEKVSNLQSCQEELQARHHEVETRLEKALVEVEKLRQEKLSAERECGIQRQFAENAERQAVLVASFLERELRPCSGDPHAAADALHETVEFCACSSDDSTCSATPDSTFEKKTALKACHASPWSGTSGVDEWSSRSSI